MSWATHADLMRAPYRKNYSTHMPESAEADAEESMANEKTPWVEVDTTWATSERIKAMLTAETEQETSKTKAGKQF